MPPARVAKTGTPAAAAARAAGIAAAGTTTQGTAPAAARAAGAAPDSGRSRDARGAEAKPAWRAVPGAVQREVERTLGTPVRRAVRTWGGYAPSATFRLSLADGRSAILKASYPLPAGSPVQFSVDREERVYRTLHHLLSPWAPAYYGSVAVDGWLGLLLEDVGPVTVPPWTRATARAALTSYGAMHRATSGAPLPRWLPRRWRGFGAQWQQLRGTPQGLDHLAGLAGGRADEAGAWLAAHVRALEGASLALGRERSPYALLHLDTRSDNIRVRPRAAVPLRIFDWPAATVGPPELDLVFFVQSIVCEGGPAPETLLRWYATAHPVRPRVLTHAAAAVAGFFALRAWQPDLPELPRLRSVQRRQLRASLRWAAALLNLPDPAWLDAVPA